MAAIRAFIILRFICSLAAAHVITPAPTPTTYPIPGLFRRAVDTCDDYSSGFSCPVGGTCYTGTNGWIGCCSTTSCYARTTCIDYQPSPTTSCDPNYGGCLQCTDSATPFCNTITNTIANQWIFFCATYAGTETVGWTNGLTDGSLAQAPPASTTSSSSASTSSTSSSTSSTSSESLRSATPAAPASTPSSPSSPTTISSTISLQPTGTQGAANGTASGNNSGSSSASHGAIAGIAVGSVAAVALVLTALWFFLRRCNGVFNKTSAASEKPNGNFEVQQSYEPTGSTAAASILTASPRPDDAKHIMDSGAAAKRYNITNPDTADIPKAPDSQVSPVTGTFASPKSSSTIGWPSPLSSRPTSSNIPYTPSQYRQGGPPDSVQHGTQPPSLPQHYSAATLASSRVPYTPSNYGGATLGSVPRTQPPPSLPLDYSTATLVSDTSSGRELSSWPYLSAEDALAGGWRNGRDSPDARRGGS